MTYAVIDTNVLVSAQISKQPQSATVKVIYSMLNGRITPVYNEEILAEYAEVLHRPKFHLNDEDIQFMLDYIRHYGIHSNRIPYAGDMPDEKDRAFYEVSLSINDSFLVTGNLKHFPVTPKVVSPADMVAIIERMSEGQVP